MFFLFLALQGGFGGISPEDVQQLMDDMRKMKIIIKGHERRIKQLEEQVRETQPQQ